jgi:hypothetical protein
MADESTDFENEWYKAQRRVGSTLRSRARWLLEMRSKTYDVMESEQQREVWWEIQAFGNFNLPPSESVYTPLANKEAEAFVCFIRDGLTRLTKGLTRSFSTTVKYTVQASNHGTIAVAMASNEPRKMLIQILGADIIRRCLRTACGRLFVRKGRQTYCSSKCSARMRLKRHRAKAKNVFDQSAS